MCHSRHNKVFGYTAVYMYSGTLRNSIGNYSGFYIGMDSLGALNP